MDPWADPEVARQEYGLELKTIDEIENTDCVIVAVAHKEFKELGLKGIRRLLQEENGVLIDVKGLYPTEELKKTDILWWRL